MTNSNESVAERRVVILGAGLGGLSAAWVLVRSGYSVTLVEKAEGAGGLAVTKQRGGFRYDLGPHNIHTIHTHILAFLARTFPQTFFEHFPRSTILKQGRFIDYPLRGIKVLLSLPLWKLPLAGISFVLARLRMFLRRPHQDASFLDWITNRFGAVLFWEYFGPYAEKVWGIPPSQIDKYVAEKRVPVIHLTELLAAALFGRSAGAAHDEFQDHNYYLKRGIGEMVDFFRDGVVGSGARFCYATTPLGIHTAGDRVLGVTIETATGSERISCDYLLSTIPLNEVIPLFDEAPQQTREAASGLDYCATVLLFLQVGRRGILPTSMLYLSEPTVRFSRIYDVGMYSSHMVPEGKTLLCLEFPCSAGDSTWVAADTELSSYAVSVMTAAGILKDVDIEDSFCERISHSYPRFRVGFQPRVKSCSDFFGTFQNFVSYGRQGSFAYLNTDNVVNMGFKAATSVISARAMGYSCHEWFTSK